MTYTTLQVNREGMAFGRGAGGWHSDGYLAQTRTYPPPHVAVGRPGHINCLWFLSDFTKENGGTCAPAGILNRASSYARHVVSARTDFNFHDYVEWLAVVRDGTRLSHAAQLRGSSHGLVTRSARRTAPGGCACDRQRGERLHHGLPGLALHPAELHPR